jgi:hypothetical protein
MAGNNAKRVKGMANAKANPNIPMAGAKIEPLTDTSTNKVQIIGPVHEKETNANVNAIKNILQMPDVLSAFLSSLVVHEAGRLIWNTPKKEAPKITSNAKNNKLKKALVERLFHAFAPKTAVIIMASQQQGHARSLFLVVRIYYSLRLTCRFRFRKFTAG